MKTEQPILITSILAADDLAKNTFIDFFGYTANGSAKCLGVCNADTSTDEQAPVTVKGIALVKTSVAFVIGDAIKVDGSGLATVIGVGPIEGYALDAASGANELIRVLLS